MLYNSNFPNNYFGQQNISQIDIPEEKNHHENDDQLGRSISRDIPESEVNNFVEKVSDKLIKLVESQLHQSMQL